jgi:putative ABC transport system permease protein
MTRHLLRIVWNRKRQNLLLAFEILLSFLVLFGVVLVAFGQYNNWRQPLGYDIDRLWTIQLGYPESGPGGQPGAPPDAAARRARAAETFQQLAAALDDLPAIERQAASWPSQPYRRGGWTTGIGDESASIIAAAHIVSAEFQDVLSIRLTAGRWFSREDDAATTEPVIVNERLARALFGEQDPLNQVFPPRQNDLRRGGRPRRVIGVIQDFRHEGELARPRNVALYRMSGAGRDAEAVLPNLLTIRVTPETTAAFEETLVRTLEGIAPDWSFTVEPVVQARESSLRVTLAPLVAVSIIAAFLLLMVALGLTGIVWQSVTRRIQEFGIRRAKGATIQNVQRQVLAELALLTSLALGVGVALVAQLPALPLPQTNFPPMPPAVWFSSVAVSAGVIYLLTLLCAWYPSRLATKIQPAEALHYE